MYPGGNPHLDIRYIESDDIDDYNWHSVPESWDLTLNPIVVIPHEDDYASKPKILDQYGLDVSGIDNANRWELRIEDDTETVHQNPKYGGNGMTTCMLTRVIIEYTGVLQHVK